MSANYNVSKGVERLADRLAAMSREMNAEVQKLVTTTTLLTQEALVDKITQDIEPHNRDGKTVTDLVDTGAYRASWQPSFPAPLMGQVATNSEYALALEYGDQEHGGHRRGFFVARDVAKKMRRVFRQRGIQLIRKYTR